MPVWLNFSSFVLFCFVFEHWTFIYYTSVDCVWFLLPYISLQSKWAWKSLKLGMSILFFFEDFRICSRLNNVNYSAWYVYKPLFGSSVATRRLACSEISLPIIEKMLKGSPGKGRTLHNLADGMTALAQLYAPYSHRARSFNQWQRALYPDFIMMYIRTHDRLNAWHVSPIHVSCVHLPL